MALVVVLLGIRPAAENENFDGHDKPLADVYLPFDDARVWGRNEEEKKGI